MCRVVLYAFVGWWAVSPHALPPAPVGTAFTYQGRLKQGSGRDIGFVAEEVGRVVPEIVSWANDGWNAQGLAYDRLTALLVQAVKEQQRQMNALKAENADVKARLEAIEALVPGPPKPVPPDHRRAAPPM